MLKLIPFILFFLLTACQETILLQGLDQKNATDILVMLAKSGVKASREAVAKQQETTYMIKVDDNDEARARELLVLNNLPRERELGLSGICKDAGLIPTPKTEKCREILGMKGEVINSLQSIPGVISADVVINVPDKQEFPDANAPQQRPAASVVLQVGDWSDAEMFTEAKIQQFVANAVTGMDTRDVVVIVSRVSLVAFDDEKKAVAAETDEDIESPVLEESVQVGGLTMDSDSAKKFRAIAAGVIFVFLLLAGGLVFLLIRMVKNRQSSQMVTTALKPVLSEKNDMDQLVDAAVSNQNSGTSK